jgi:allophanate hydrolase
VTFDGSLDQTTLQRAYDSGVLTPEALCELISARVADSRDPNVWIHLQPKATLLEAARALGTKRDPSKPLWGIPFGVKDNIDVAGMPTTAACREFAYLPEQSAPVVQRLLAAGALCVGKTNMDQFATGLVGTRSPYGACHNVFDPRYLAGGSSSGSAVAVAGGQVSFALGTDTAGSGRVPAALGNIVGLKPTRGLLSNDGVVPACRSLDCVSVFALGCADAARVREVMATDSDSGTAPALRGGASLHAKLTTPRLPATGLRIGTPRPSQLEFFGDADAQRGHELALSALEALGGKRVEIDWAPFAAIGDLLYGGPWLAERALAVGDFIRAQPDAVLPITAAIIAKGDSYSARDAFAGLYRLDELRAQAERAWEAIDVLVVPTTPTIYTLADDARDPRQYNDRQGIYTRFANFLGYPVLAVPAGFKSNGLPFGVSLVSRNGADRALDALGLRLERRLALGAGRARLPLPASDLPSDPPAGTAGGAVSVRLAVVGAHLRGLALNHQLQDVGATFVTATRTAPSYRLFALPHSQPKKPGLQRIASGGAALEIELWDVPSETFGAFMAKVPAPLGIGNLECEDGQWVKGFICEAYALQGADDITSFGGFRAYLASLQ